MKNINFISPINPLGYGTVGYNLLRALSNRGYEVSLFPIGEPQFPGGDELLIKNAVGRAPFYNPDAPCIRLWHQFSQDQFVGRRKRIGFPIFELNRFTAQEQHQLKSLDHIIVCSKWAEQVVRDNGIDVPTTVVPLGVDTSIFRPRQDYREQRPPWLKDTTVFLNIGKWEVRKGHDQLLEAFNAAFEPGDNVELWMINENPFIGYENTLWKKKYADSKMGAHINFHPRYESHEHLVRLYNQADCFVTLSKAEGFNLEALEAMACGAHVIGTNYSGHTEFMNNENSLLINPVGMELANDGKWFNGQGEWAVFSTDEIVAQMIFVHDMLKDERRLGRNLNGIETAQQFTWDASVVELEKDL